MFDIQYLIKEWLDTCAILYPCIKHILKQSMKIVTISVHWKWDRLVIYWHALFKLSDINMIRGYIVQIFRHRGVQLILAYSWARPAVLAAGKGRGGMFLFLLLLHFHSFSSFSPSLSFISSTISSIFLLPFSERWHKMTYKGWCVIKPQ